MRSIRKNLMLIGIVVLALAFTVSAAFAQETVTTVSTAATGVITGLTFAEVAVLSTIVIGGAGVFWKYLLRAGR